MAKKAKRGAPKGAQPNRIGGSLISIDKDERKRLRNRREKLELTQPQLATQLGFVPATISNLESGRSKQVRRVVYAAVVRRLFSEEVPVSDGEFDELYKNIVEGTAELDAKDRKVVAGLVTSLRNR